MDRMDRRRNSRPRWELCGAVCGRGWIAEVGSVLTGVLRLCLPSVDVPHGHRGGQPSAGPAEGVAPRGIPVSDPSSGAVASRIGARSILASIDEEDGADLGGNVAP